MEFVKLLELKKHKILHFNLRENSTKKSEKTMGKREGRSATRQRRRFSNINVLIIFLVCGIFVKTSNALREDQLGTYDWHLKFVGDVQFVSFLTETKNDRNKLIVTTNDSNIIASLNQKEGAIEWRVTLDESDTVDYASLVSATTNTKQQKSLLVLSSKGKFIRALDIEDGSMIWETIAYTEAAASEELYLESTKDVGIDILPLGKDVDGDTIHDFLVLAKGTVALRSLADGVTQWKTNVAEAIATENNEKCHLEKVCLEEGSNIVYVVGVSTSDSSVCGASLRVSDGYVTQSAVGGSKLSGVVGEDGKYSIFCAGENNDKVFVALKRSSKPRKQTFSVVTIDASAFFEKKGGDASIFADVPVKKLGVNDADASISNHKERDGIIDTRSFIKLNSVASAGDEKSYRSSRSAGAMILSSDAGEVTLLRFLEKSKQLTSVRSFPDKNKVAVSFHNDELFVVESSKLSSSSSILKVTSQALIGNGNDALQIAEWRIGDDSNLLKNYAHVKSVFADPKTTNAVVVHRDAFLTFVDKTTKTNPIWTREESIATASESMFGYLPEAISVHTDAREQANAIVVKSSLKESARVQYLALAARLNRADAEMRAELAKLRRSRGTKLLPTRDDIGFRRSLLFLTPTGSLIALHNGDGRVLWRTHLGCAKNEWKYTALIPWEVDGKEALLTVAKNATMTIVQCMYQENGAKAAETTYYDFVAVRLVPLEVSGEDSRIFFVDDVGEASVFPLETESRESTTLNAVRRAIPRNSYYVVDEERNEVRGYSFALTHKGAGASGVHTWTITFPPESGNIVGFSRKAAQTEPVHAWVKVPGDRSTMFKYINPNVFFIATDDGRGIHAHLVEGVSGRIIYRVYHAKAKGPVFATLCENWITYSYYDTDAQRHALSVLEVYDDSETRKNKAVSELVLKSLFGRSTSSKKNVSSSLVAGMRQVTDDDETVLSSFTPPPLRVLGQSYFIRPGTKFMRVTSSARGITGHQVLLGTDTDQVVALDKRWLDPRRPTKPSIFDRDEGLIPYMEVLPLSSSSWVTNKNVVARLKDVVTAPTALESTVLCFARGVDVFYTRLHPSQSFDALDEEFSYGLLIISLLVVGFTALATHSMSVKATSKRLWK